MTITTQLNKLAAQRLTFPRGSDGRIQFTNAFRKEVCELVATKQLPATHIAKALGLASSQIWKWKTNYSKTKYDSSGIAVSRMKATDPIASIEAKRSAALAEVEKMTTAIKLLKELGL